jgi:hypothetical protein
MDNLVNEGYISKKYYGTYIYRVTIGDLIPDNNRKSLNQFGYPDEMSGSIAFMDLLNNKRNIYLPFRDEEINVNAITVLYMGIEPEYQGKLKYLIFLRDKIYSLSNEWNIEAIVADKIKNEKFRKILYREGFVSLHKNGSRYFAYKFLNN